MAKKENEKKIENEIETTEESENNVDKIAELTIDLDLEREKRNELETKLTELQKKYDDEHKANMRLMDRINAKEDKEEKHEESKKQTPLKITELYDFKSGKLVLKNK